MRFQSETSVFKFLRRSVDEFSDKLETSGVSFSFILLLSFLELPSVKYTQTRQSSENDFGHWSNLKKKKKVNLVDS